MKKVYIIELGGRKERWEMDALELEDINSALEWIQGTMDSDSEYFNVDIQCNIYVQKYEQYDTVNKAIVYINAESIVTEEMFDSDIYSIDTIIESNLSVVSKIIGKGKIKMVGE